VGTVGRGFLSILIAIRIILKAIDIALPHKLHPSVAMTPPKSKLLTSITKVVNPAFSKLGAALKLKPKARVPKLEVRLSAKQKPDVYDLIGDRYTLGRSSSKCDIVVQTPLVSQVHAQLVRDSKQKKSQFVIQDQDSTNGIYRRRQRLKSSPLRHNMVISLGPPELEAAVTLRFVNPPPWYIRALQYTGIGIASAVTILVAAIAVEVSKVPDVRPLPVSQQGPVEVLSADGTTSIGPEDIAKHTELSRLNEFGQILPKAVIASEDTSFYWNIGVDPIGVLRALVTNVRSGSLREGASTITQQLARNLLGRTYVGNDDSAGRKWREAAAAIKLTLNYSKDDLLTIYLNRVYLGNGIYGFQDAAKLYFNKSAAELDLSEAATLAGILPAPEVINPFKNKQLAIEYRDRILNRMAELGIVKEEEAERARRSILRLNLDAKTKIQGTIAPYFYGYVFDEMQEILGENFAREGNLIVETNLDVKMQKASDAALKEGVNRDGAGYGFSQGAIVTIDAKNGSIIAMTGGVDFKKSQYNRAAQARRQPGSTFKLFDYAAALEQGISPNTVFSCSATQGIAGCHNGGSGSINMYRGFALSENVVAIRVAESAGLENVIKIARKLGVKSKMEPTSNLVLGGFEVSMLEMVGAYGAIANQGIYRQPHAIVRILDSRDCKKPKDIKTCRVIFDAAQDFPARQAIDANVANTMIDMMTGTVQYGTGRPAAIPQARVVGKTGTTDEGRDLWFIGIVPSRQVVAAVWLGNDEGVTSGSSSLAAQVWSDYMKNAIR
jgi:membrane peptidoglycan carboxypeptidase